MKEKVLTLIIGILIGAILATGGFLIYNKVNEDNTSTDMSKAPQMPEDGQMPSGRPMLEKGEMPSGDQMPGDGQKPDGEPPAKPGEESNTNKTQDINLQNQTQNQ